MTDRNDFRRTPRRNIEFTDRDFESRPDIPEARGLRDEHWDADREYYDDGYDDVPRNGADRYPEDEYADDRYDDGADTPGYDDPYDDQYDDGGYDEPRYEGRYGGDRYDDVPPAPRGGYSEARRPAAPEPKRDSYREGYRDGYRDNDADRPRRNTPPSDNDDMNTDERQSFRKRHPIVMNLIYACVATCATIWIALWFLDFWTHHGQERAVPDVKGQSYEMAQGNISRAGLRTVITDSVYDSYARPGTVVEQSPIPLARIKRGGTVYLTLVAFTPKMVTIPDFYDVSERQARSMLEGLGITQVMVQEVSSEYAGLVMGAKFNGVALRPGAKVPVTAVITLEVGAGLEDNYDDGAPIDSVAIEEAVDVLNID